MELWHYKMFIFDFGTVWLLSMTTLITALDSLVVVAVDSTFVLNGHSVLEALKDEA